MTDELFRMGRGVLLLAAVWMGVGCTASIAQISGTNSTPAPATKNAKTLAFEVVSIRPSKPGDNVGGITWGIQPDGYRARGQSLWSTIMLAYLPETLILPVRVGRIKDPVLGAPSWARDEYYDIDAKVAPEDVAAWQKQGTQKAMLRAMLQAMLAERCKLVVHRTPVEVAAYALVIGKHGPQMKDASPNLPATDGMTLLDGGKALFTGERNRVEWSFFGASMTGLAAFLSGTATSMIQNKTDLTGRYDFVLRHQDDTAHEDVPPPEEIWDLDAVGLMLKPIKVPIEAMAIDHVERPSEN